MISSAEFLVNLLNYVLEYSKFRKMERSIKTAKRNLKGLQKTFQKTKFHRRQPRTQDNLAHSIAASQSIEIDDLRAPQIFTIEGSSINIEEQPSSSSDYQFYATICGNFLIISWRSSGPNI